MFRIEDRGAVRWLTIDRPERKNAIPGDGWNELRSLFRAFEQSTQRVLVLRGAGGNFCSGADLSATDAETLESVSGAYRRMQDVGAAARALHHLTKPTIAAVDGVAVGAGMNLALGCDVVIATVGARFSEIFAKRGLTVDFGGTWLLPRLVGLQVAKNLALTGRIVEGPEALRIGLVLDVVEDADALESAATAKAAEFERGAPLAQMFTKQALNASLGRTFEQSLQAEDQAQPICLQSDDAAEGISAFLQKREPDFKGR